MSDMPCCPHCGAPMRAALPGETGDRAVPGDRGLDPLYREVRRIREIAELREDASGSRVAELTREVQELRATVARLRGSAAAAPSC
ncbi:MAG TPA: hypothetical protein VEC76_00015 [Streptosporangiaceae bacterium]|nr:hypothetical protein [Streptosporangiaceae bacterium]